MSFAWSQLQAAIRSLAGPGDRRERLAGALNKIIKLKARDLPGEISADYALLVGRISRFPVKNIPQEIKTEVEALSDIEVMQAMQKIMSMYDVVAAYQPRPVRHSGGIRCRTQPAVAWPIPAQHILETRQGAFFHETA